MKKKEKKKGFTQKKEKKINLFFFVFYAETGQNIENPVTGSHKDSMDSEDSSPRCVLEIPVSGVDSDNSSSSNGSSSSSADHGAQWRNLIGVLRKKSMRRLSTFPLTSSEIYKRNLSRKLARIRSAEDGIRDYEKGKKGAVWKPSWRSFEYEELAAATDNFSSGERFSLFSSVSVFHGSVLPCSRLVENV